ncbi:hypothetical protein Leryth_020765 [Lithospermum erythrorhizon]|nr:hypothetical protein Leryth_020765 [Lithospermum erythrorhizon]
MPSGSDANASGNFWNRDHKLGISTGVLLPLYNAAKQAFIEAVERYKKELKEEYGEDSVSASFLNSLDCPENDVMKHSRALLLLSSDFGTAWNSRKQIVSKKQQLAMFVDELHLSKLILSYSPKSERAWSHRRWAIKIISRKFVNLQEIVEEESELVKGLAERSKMNYRAWNHRCWLVSYMSRGQILHELRKSKDWAGLNVADSSCFHYRARLLLWLLDHVGNCNQDANFGVELYLVWKEELNWVEGLIKRYIGREALWLHRRFLSVCWINHFATLSLNAPGHDIDKSLLTHDTDIFISNELQLFQSCTVIPDNNFEDYKAQATYAATYIMWLMKQVPEFPKVEASKLNILLKELCPEKSTIWDGLISLCGNI